MTVTFNGLSKAYRVAGFRQGWMVLNGPKHHAKGYIEGLDMLSSMRLCANTPMQHAIQTALGGYQSINEFILPGGRLLEQRNRAWELVNQIPGVSCVKPMGAMYMFPKIDTEMYRIRDDMKFVYDLLVREKSCWYRERGLIGSNPTISALLRCLTSIRLKRRWAGWQDSCKPTISRILIKNAAWNGDSRFRRHFQQQEQIRQISVCRRRLPP